MDRGSYGRYDLLVEAIMPLVTGNTVKFKYPRTQQKEILYEL